MLGSCAYQDTVRTIIHKIKVSFMQIFLPQLLFPVVALHDRFWFGAWTVHLDSFASCPQNDLGSASLVILEKSTGLIPHMQCKM